MEERSQKEDQLDAFAESVIDVIDPPKQPDYAELMSPRIDKIAAAMAQFQSELEDPVCNRTVDYRTKKGERLTYAYADLASCWKAVRKCQAKHELSIFHIPLKRSSPAEPLAMVQFVVHSSGQWFRQELSMMPSENGPKAIGSTTTYLSRYLLKLVGLAPVGEDDDGTAGDESMDISNLSGAGKKRKGEAKPKKNGRAMSIYEGAEQIEKNHVERVKILTGVLRSVLNDPAAEWTSEYLMERKPSETEWDDIEKECERITNEYLDEITALADRK